VVVISNDGNEEFSKIDFDFESVFVFFNIFFLINYFEGSKENTRRTNFVLKNINVNLCHSTTQK